MSAATVETLQWVGDADGQLKMIDQTLLPTEFREITLDNVEAVWESIKSLRVRGAPAIGIAAAYGVCVALRNQGAEPLELAQEKANQAADYLATSRPTAVNLFWALDRMRRVVSDIDSGSDTSDLQAKLLAEAKSIHEEDRKMCHEIGRYGASLLKDGQGVLTHCNAGGLATAEYGTALSCFFTAQDEGKNLTVYVDETRPLLQGARLTAWELQRRNIEAILICDSMAAQVMREGRVSAVITGADRIAANGDSANKIGTYSLAVLARHHGIPFFIAAPSSTFDLSIANGDQIPIEERASEEITNGFGKQTAPDGIATYNPAFDVTPAEYIRGIITERGIIDPVTQDQISLTLGVC